AGRHYHFIDRAEFDMLRDSDALLEWAEVHGNFYGTPRKPVEEAMAAGRDMLFDIDWQGAQQLQEKMAADVVSIFILPPSMTELQSRLHRRAEDTAEVIATRLANSRAEIEHWHEYDYVILNDDLDAAFDAVQSIVKAERLRRDRRHGMYEFVTKLLTEQPAL
ncbi:MAG TPA: guanylate kinase, partial [Mycoplana sp.]|nr:guanylate kinase [Mycoplana sp.]